MATPRQNYARQFQAYAQGIEPDIPASVRTYSIFNPDTGTWQRMTNGFRSPIPAQGQPVVPVQAPAQPAVDPVVAALAMAQQTQGRDWSRFLPQTPAQMPSRGSVRPSPASEGGGASVSLSPAPEAPQRASQRGFKASGQDGLLSLDLPVAKVSPVPTPTVPIVPIARAASTVVVPSQAPLTMADQHRRAAVLLGTLPNPDPTPIPSIWPGLGRFLSNGLARFALDD